jgi:hypothetical protein
MAHFHEEVGRRAVLVTCGRLATHLISIGLRSMQETRMLPANVVLA